MPNRNTVHAVFNGAHQILPYYSVPNRNGTGAKATLSAKSYLIIRCLIGTAVKEYAASLPKSYLIIRCLIGTPGPQGAEAPAKSYLIIRCLIGTTK